MSWIASVLLALASLAGHGRPVIAVAHGRMHLATAGKQVCVPRGEALLLRPPHRGEGIASTLRLSEEQPFGLHLSLAIDIIGPDWLLLDLQERSDGVVVCTWDTGTGEGEALWYPSFNELRRAEAKQAVLIQDAVNRSGMMFLDFDRPENP